MTDGQRTALIVVGVGIVAFLVGAGWQFARANSLSGELDVAERAAALNGLEATLGAATIEAQRGSYELARQHASDFFTGLQSDIAVVSGDTAQALSEILARRDAMITALSRSSPESASMLAQLFTRFRLARGRPVGPEADTQPGVPPAPVDSGVDSVPPAATTGS